MLTTDLETVPWNTRNTRNSTRIRAVVLTNVAAALLAGCAGHSIAAPSPAGPATPVAAPLDAATARAQLATLPVKGRAPKTGYSRDQFGPAWSDDVDVQYGHDGCDTRSNVLRRDLHNVVPATGCRVDSGILDDPYTGRQITYQRGRRTGEAVQIDHVVPLALAWQTGAQQLTARERRNFANDPLNLLAVDGPTNVAKSDGDAATWLPPNKAERCPYVELQVAVKVRYRLWVTAPERDALTRVLAGC